MDPFFSIDSLLLFDGSHLFIMATTGARAVGVVVWRPAGWIAGLLKRAVRLCRDMKYMSLLF